MQTPDYTGYTFRQLYEALDGIRGEQYPQILTALEAAIRGRPNVPKADLEEVYFHLDQNKFPEHERRLREEIEAQGGFDTIAPETVTDENRYHTGWRRFWAMIFDAIILFAVMASLAMPIEGGNQDNLALKAALDYTTTLFSILYYILMHAAFGQTLGKMITGVKVVRNSDFNPISFRHALMRDIVPLVFIIVSIAMVNYFDIGIADDKKASLQVPMIVVITVMVQFIWPLLELVTMLFNRRRRAIHDFIAGTVVTRYLRNPVQRCESGNLARASV